MVVQQQPVVAMTTVSPSDAESRAVVEGPDLAGVDLTHQDQRSEFITIGDDVVGAVLESSVGLTLSFSHF